MNLEVGSEIDLRIERLGVNGEGVGSFCGFTVFVEGALPGETARVRIYELRKNFGRGKPVLYHQTSLSRVDPICPLFGQCGGCQLMHMGYSHQLQSKRQRVVDALERIGKFFGCDVLECEPSPADFCYRNKIQLPVVDGKLGLYAYNTHEIVPIETCHIHCSLGEKVFQYIRCALQKISLDELRHVLIKTAVYTQQVLVVLVTRKQATPALLSFAKELLATIPEVQGVMQNMNPSSGNTVLGNSFEILAGQGYIEERLHELVFKVSPASFFQVNPPQAEKLYDYALECAALGGEERVLDAFCGVGTLTLILARHAKEVIGVECVSAAIEDARQNAVRNNISNVLFHCDLAEEVIASLTDIDVAILNPPRKGCEMALLTRLVLLKPRRIVYISCDPATLARDLAFLCSQGYQLDRVRPFDMFPQTAHVETVAQLSI